MLYFACFLLSSRAISLIKIATTFITVAHIKINKFNICKSKLTHLIFTTLKIRQYHNPSFMEGNQGTKTLSNFSKLSSSKLLMLSLRILTIFTAHGPLFTFLLAIIKMYVSCVPRIQPGNSLTKEIQATSVSPVFLISKKTYLYQIKEGGQ